MRCDTCKKDYLFWELMWNGKHIYFDMLCTVRKRKMVICSVCGDIEDKLYSK